MGDGDVSPTQFFYPQVTHYGTSFVGGLTVCRGFEIMQNSNTPSPSLKKTPLFVFLSNSRVRAENRNHFSKQICMRPVSEYASSACKSPSFMLKLEP